MNSNSTAKDGWLTRVLIVEDNPDAAKVLGILLERCGYEVDMVIDSTNAYRVLNRSTRMWFCSTLQCPKSAAMTLPDKSERNRNLSESASSPSPAMAVRSSGTIVVGCRLRPAPHEAGEPGRAGVSHYQGNRMSR